MFLVRAAKYQIKQSFSIKSTHKSFIQQTFRYNSDSVNRTLTTTTERDFLRKVIENTEGCSIFTPSQVLEPNILLLLQRDELINKLIELTRKFLLNRFEHMNNEEKIQKLLPPLHRECIAQYCKWSIETNLFVMDIWKTYLDRPNEQLFFNESMNRYLNEIYSLPDPIALQVMYYAACGWKWKSNLYEENIIRKMNKLMQDNKTPFDHMAIYCLALFKNSPEIGDVNFIDTFLKYLLVQDFQDEESIAVSCMIKAARKFATRDQIHQIENIQTKLLSYADSHCDLISLTHIIQLGQKQRVYNRQLIELVLNLFANNLNKLRAKDVERCLLSIATFNFESSDRIEERFCEKALEYLKSCPEERNKFPDSVIRCISYLAVKGFYDETLLKWALEFATYNSKKSLNYNFLTIDAFAKINLANSYRGPVLSNDLVSMLAEENGKVNYNKRFLDDLKNIFDKNHHNYIVCRPMPHSGDRIFLFVYNKRTNRTVKMNLHVDESKILTAAELHQNDPVLKVVALVPCNLIFRSNKYSGFDQMKLNQLKSLGFEVIVCRKINWNKNLDEDLKQWYLTLELYKLNVFLFDKSK